jgi:hypothetical protein
MQALYVLKFMAADNKKIPAQNAGILIYRANSALPLASEKEVTSNY